MSRRRRRSGGRQASEAFWGEGYEAGLIPAIRPAADPAAVARSLGDPPLAIDGATASRSLSVVYEEAVRAATALAAANALLDDGADPAIEDDPPP